jgi:hypothetical protein
MEAKHTPGPWRVGDAGCTVFGPKTDAPSPKTVASITRQPIPSAEHRANAALIAAAPDMYEALVEAQGMLRQYAEYSDAMASALGRGWSGSSDTGLTPAHVYLLVAKAISKAKAATADGVLNAAAPDMEAAGSEAMGAIATALMHIRCGDAVSNEDEMQAAFDSLSAAIAKAEGR